MGHPWCLGNDCQLVRASEGDPSGAFCGDDIAEGDEVLQRPLSGDAGSMEVAIVETVASGAGKDEVDRVLVELGGDVVSTRLCGWDHMVDLEEEPPVENGNQVDAAIGTRGLTGRVPQRQTITGFARAVAPPWSTEQVMTTTRI